MPPGGAARADEAARLVQPQRLRVHADELGRDPDHVLGGLVDAITASAARANSSSRGSSPLERGELLERVALRPVSFFGTTICTRASRSPRLPESPIWRAAALDAQHHAVARAGGHLQRTRSPSGVGTSIVAPAAASTKAPARRRSSRRRAA